MAAQRNDRPSAKRVRDKDIAAFAEEHKDVRATLPLFGGCSKGKNSNNTPFANEQDGLLYLAYKFDEEL
jgi:hypothetical protein